MALLIGGHPRSGTSLLQELCNAHPDLFISFEFGNFLSLNRPLPVYRKRLLKRIWRIKDVSIIADDHGLRRRLSSLRCALRFLWQIQRAAGDRVRLEVIERAVRKSFRPRPIVGDKYPGYVFQLDRLTKFRGIHMLIIYRDCRDVASSTLRKVRTDWAGRRWTQHYDTAEKVGERWVEAIRQMEAHMDRVFAIRYENLVREPQGELARMGQWLGVDPAGFPLERVRDTSIGKFRQGLTPQELEELLAVAGPAMARRGYES